MLLNFCVFSPVDLPFITRGRGWGMYQSKNWKGRVKNILLIMHEHFRNISLMAICRLDFKTKRMLMDKEPTTILFSASKARTQ